MILARNVSTNPQPKRHPSPAKPNHQCHHNKKRNKETNNQTKTDRNKQSNKQRKKETNNKPNQTKPSSNHPNSYAPIRTPLDVASRIAHPLPSAPALSSGPVNGRIGNWIGFVSAVIVTSSPLSFNGSHAGLSPAIRKKFGSKTGPFWRLISLDNPQESERADTPRQLEAPAQLPAPSPALVVPPWHLHLSKPRKCLSLGLILATGALQWLHFPAKCVSE